MSDEIIIFFDELLDKETEEEVTKAVREAHATIIAEEDFKEVETKRELLDKYLDEMKEIHDQFGDEKLIPVDSEYWIKYDRIHAAQKLTDKVQPVPEPYRSESHYARQMWKKSRR